MIFYIGCIIVDRVLGTQFIGIIYSLVLLLPGLAAAARRLHDTGKSAWWLLIGLIPLLGAIVLIVFMVQDSEAGDNAYGANPKQPA